MTPFHKKKIQPVFFIDSTKKLGYAVIMMTDINTTQEVTMNASKKISLVKIDNDLSAVIDDATGDQIAQIYTMMNGTWEVRIDGRLAGRNLKTRLHGLVVFRSAYRSWTGIDARLSA